MLDWATDLEFSVIGRHTTIIKGACGDAKQVPVLLYTLPSTSNCRHFTVLYNHYILPQSSRDFDPEAHPEVKKPPDPNEIRSQGIKQSFYFDPDKNYIKLYQEISRNDPASPTLDP